jgi:short-subunit dehydrogenase
MINSSNTVCITGASRGIGRTIAHAFSAMGFPLILTARSVDHLSKVKEECLNTGSPKVELVEVDFLGDNPLRELAQLQSKPSILINNAGDFLCKDLQDSTDQDYLHQFSVNALGTIRVTDHLLPVLSKQKQALIVNICSKASVVGYADASAYSVSKHALYGYGKALRAHLLQFAPHVACTNILLGQTLSSSWDGLDVDHELLIDPVDVAEVILGLTSLGTRTVVEEITIMPSKGELPR